ncbi:MAG: hypothetical protein ACRDRO_11685, partial [Pseudonocardiaceae bacterium]
ARVRFPQTERTVMVRDRAATMPRLKAGDRPDPAVLAVQREAAAATRARRAAATRAENSRRSIERHARVSVRTAQIDGSTAALQDSYPPGSLPRGPERNGLPPR